MRNKYFIFIIVLAMNFFTACKDSGPTASDHTYQAFHSLILEELIYATEMSAILTPGKIISRPPGISQLITSFVVLRENTVKNNRLCLYYTAPFKEQPGELALTESDGGGLCSKVLNEGTFLYRLQGVTDFKSQLRDYYYEIFFTLHKEARKIRLPLINLEFGVEHEKYRAQKVRSLYSGLKILKINSQHFNIKNSFFLGELSDRFENNTAIRCMQISKECKLIGEDLCDRCRYGSYEVVDYNCAQGGSKFCGQNRCGQKNEPACPIGAESKTSELAGICQGDLSLVLNADQVWICQ